MKKPPGVLIAKMMRRNILIGILIVSLGIFAYGKHRSWDLGPAIEQPREEVSPYNLLTGQSAIIWDIKTGQTIFAKHAEARLPIASITKVLTAAVALSHLDQNSTIDLPPTVVLEFERPNVVISGRWMVRDLIRFMLINSSNEIATLLAQEVSQKTGKSFAILMNDTARQLGMRNSSFVSPTGLDMSKASSSNLSSAADVATLFSYVYTTYPQIFSITAEPSHKFITGDSVVIAHNTDILAGTLPGLLASKTGLTPQAGGSLAIVYEIRPRHPLVVVILNSTQEERFIDIKRLVHFANTRASLLE